MVVSIILIQSPVPDLILCYLSGDERGCQLQNAEERRGPDEKHVLHLSFSPLSSVGQAIQFLYAVP